MSDFSDTVNLDKLIHKDMDEHEQELIRQFAKIGCDRDPMVETHDRLVALSYILAIYNDNYHCIYRPHKPEMGCGNG